MQSSRILVTGLPAGTTKTDLTIYFQSPRDSEGGDVKNIEIDGKQAIITFEDVKAASRVVGKRKHCLKNRRLLVSLLSEAAESSEPEDEDDDSLEMDDQLGQNEHGAVNNSSENHQSSNQNRNHGAEARTEQDRTTSKILNEAQPQQQCTVKVTGLLVDTSEDLLTNYFENERRSKGGPISGVDIDRDLLECLITFESPDDAARTVEHSPHKVGSLCLDVSLLEVVEDNILDAEEEESVDESNIAIIVSGTLPSKDALWYYFDNERRSGGGEVLKMEYTDEGDAVITFCEVKDLKRLLEGPHSIDAKRITVVRRPPKKKVPLDPLKVHVLGLNETTSKDCLRFYLEKFGKAEVSKVYKGCNNNAMAIFDADLDIVALFDKVSKDRKGLEGKHLRLERVPICSCILVKGLKKETSDDTIELYFENNRKSGGNRVDRVERKEKDEALVYFDDPSSVQNVIKRSHVLDEQNLDVKPYYPFLENTATNKTELVFDAEVFDYIKMNHQDELQAVLDENKVLAELSEDSKSSQSSIIAIFPAEKKNDSRQVWNERADGLKSFLYSFKKIQIPIAAELFDEITRRWQKEYELNINQASSNYLVSFNAHSRCAQIIGRVACVDEEVLRLERLIDAAQKDTELMKSIVEVDEPDILTSRLTLLKMSGIDKRLQKEHQHLTISFDLNGNRLRLRGPRSVLQEVKLEVYKFISKVKEQTLELPTNVITVLKKLPVSDHIQGLLKEKEIQALFVYDQSKSSNEVQVVAVGPKSVTNAEMVIQDAIQERSLQLTQENRLVLERRQWKDFQSNLTSTFKIGIFADRSSSTLWVSGIAEDANTCFERVKQFLAVNTILHDSFLMDKGTTRFIVEKCGPKLDRIKEDLAGCCLDLRIASDCEGVDVSGTSEGLQKCLPKLQELVNAVQKDLIPIDKPGMKKFILQGKGQKSLRAIEDNNHCVILATDINEHDMSLTDVATEIGDVGMPSAKFMCSYLTIEGKKVSVLKGDLTKHRADAIVNAANSQLNHVGGLALAIVTAGGKEIQNECNEYIRDKGDLLEGRTMVSTAGGLPCDRVIHTVGPKWDPTESQKKKEKKKGLLNYAITNCLKTATSLRSIAIPAVSSGVYGFPRDLCAEVILDAVLDFCKENPSCQLSEIHLINNDDPTVKAFVEEMRKRFSGKTTFVDSEKPEVANSGLAAWSRPKPRHNRKTPGQTAQGIHITVKVGDLAKEKADILVGTSAPNLDLNKNPSARALSEAAGQSLQQQCTQKCTQTGLVAEGDIAVLNQTGNLKCRAVIFAVCSQWKRGKGKEVLKGILTKVLQEADNANMTSIAFAAIGTGTLQFPRDQVADIYFDEVMSFSQKHPKTSIKDVRFVLYDKDIPTVQAFQAAELTKQNSTPVLAATNAASKNPKDSKHSTSSHGSVAFTPVKERNPGHFETTVGPLCFQVQPGDITKETTDAIAVISNSDLDISASGAGAAILRSGGDSIKKECTRHGSQTPGSVVVTKAGNLNARYLYHIVPTDLTPTGLNACLMQCLQEAEKNGISSISFPAIGTGNLGMPAKSCAQGMLSAIHEMSKKKPRSLNLIKMTVFQESMIKDIQSAMEEASGKKPSQEPTTWRRFKTGFQTVANAFGFGGSEESTDLPASSQETDNRKIDLEVVAGCKRHLQEALKAVNELMKENCTQKKIENEAISNLTREHMHRIHTLELRYSVEVTVEKEVDRIVVDGQYEDILQVLGEIHEILHEVKKDEHERSRAEVLSKDVQWKYKENGKFEDYEGERNAQIELAYQQKTPDDDVVVIRDEKMREYEIDFDAMTEKDEDSNITEIRRIDLRKDVEVPDYWVPQPTDPSGREETVHLFELDPTKDDQEYKKVGDKFRLSCQNNIIKIERVQNPTLYGAYAVYKQTMDKVGVRGSNEMCLFHGTKGSKCELINHKGFNRSFCGENAACHGNGVYFAAQANYSARSTYSPADIKGHRYMYLAMVLVGEYTLGKQGMITPPVKNTTNLTDTYDTVVNDVSNPAIYVVFYDWQCYPEYLITFQ